MPTPATSVRFEIYESGETPRILTVFNPAQNIIYSDKSEDGLEIAIGIANLPDSPLKIDFRSTTDAYGFSQKLVHGLYDFDPASDTSGWPEWKTLSTGSPDDPLILSNEASILATTTLPPATTTTTTLAFDAQINWNFVQNASGRFKIWVNGTAVVDTTTQDAGTLLVFAGDQFFVEITDNGVMYGEINIIDWLGGVTTQAGAGNWTSVTKTVVLGESWSVNGQSGN